MDIDFLIEKIGFTSDVEVEVKKSYRFLSDESKSAALRLTTAEYGSATEKLREILSPDDCGYKILACSMTAAIKTYENYLVKGISDEIFFDTMKCFSRFCKESSDEKGRHIFDRWFWTGRQLSARLFRIGELEYEIECEKGGVFIHVPSDAILTRENIVRSLIRAKEFLKKYFAEYSEAEFYLESWLLAPHLKKLLGKNSKILAFADMFEITDVYPDDKGYELWLFGSSSLTVKDYPENTSLQKNAKKFLLGGGKIGSAKGMLKKF